MMLFLIFPVFLAMSLGMIPAAIARYKGYSFFLWWAFGVILIVVTLPMALLLTPTAGALRRRERVRDDDFVECPSCQMHIRAEATVCWFCRRHVMPTRATIPGLRAAIEARSADLELK